MSNFIEDYLDSPTAAILSARERSYDLSWASDIDEDMIYDSLASGDFKLLQSIIL